jgi:hypothetical protein
MLDEPLGDDRGHHLGGVMNALAPAVAQCKREGVSEVFGLAGVRRLTSDIVRGYREGANKTRTNRPRDIAIVSYVGLVARESPPLSVYRAS